ncbi:hypothetical protein [Stenotrophomonas maltophilia]|uniref:hypothetical protein n=1 Tax=Stenotrophomonas maltophilia TaxID=40324 RepID=UPI000C157AB7|nr:hypothetical protein [Stenotrophomonas maltophilia]
MSAQEKYSLQERGRFKAWWDAARPLEGSAFPYEIAWAAWQAALSAQPSPGGQGDALVTDEMVTAASRAYYAASAVGSRTCMRAALEAALSARQPDTAHAAYHTGKAIGRREAELEAAARQPVGSIPEWFELVIRDVCELDPEDPDAADTADTVCIRLLDLRLIMERHALPAQAVDLGGLREMLESWTNSDYPFSYEGQCAQRALDACVADLQGWLDSQAVGK